MCRNHAELWATAPPTLKPNSAAQMAMPQYNNNARRHHSRGTFIQPASHNSQQTIQNIVYPPAPMIQTIPLPPVDSSGTATAAAVSPSRPRPLGAHSARERRWILNSVLKCHEFLHPVVEPIVSDMPSYVGHMWGARDHYINGSIRGKTVHFADSAVSATNPPLARLRLAAPNGDRLIVNPTIGNDFVSVGDVQRTVIAWMRRVEQMTYRQEGPGLTRRKTVRASDGMASMDVDVWVWRGLVKVEGRIDLWAINL